MSGMELLGTQLWVERLGWSLIHFLWEGVLIALLYGAARVWAIRKAGASGRYLLACAALVAMLAAPVVTLYALGDDYVPAVSADRTARIPGKANDVLAILPTSVRADVPDHAASSVVRWVVGLWMLGASVFMTRLLGGWLYVGRLYGAGLEPADAEWQEAFGRMCARIGISFNVKLRVSRLVRAPAAIGLLRPVVLMPLGTLAGLSTGQVEALLVHELAHVLRRDYLVNLLQSAAEALLFYHPAVWWVSGHMRAEREACCDDMAVAVSGDVLTYVQALTELETRSTARLAVAANGGSLVGRVARLLGLARPSVGMPAPMVAGVILAGVSAFGLLAQSAERPAFQVASIKRNTTPPPNRKIVRPEPGGRLFAENATVQMLIQNAYRIQAYQVDGGPQWVNTDGYDIVAKPEGEATTAQTWLMLQTLLADRFALAVHRETRELPVFVMTLAKTGVKSAAAKPCEGQAASAVPCGKVRVSMEPTDLLLEGRSVPVAELVGMVAAVVGRPVIDRTGFTGSLDVQVKLAREEGAPGLAGPAGVGGPPSADIGAPNIFAALEEQLGLKLSQGKGPVEVLVIDHIERPTVN